jgi:hypothetical protein
MDEHVRSATPLKWESWRDLLAGYVECQVVVDGLRDGFSLGVRDEGLLRSSAASGVDQVVMAKMRVEVEKGRILGPFSRLPLPDLHISPVKAVEKRDSGKYRLIHNLSAPIGCSVNDAIPREVKSVSYCSVKNVVDCLLRSGRSMMFMTKLDIKDAFRVVPVRRADWKYLGIQIGGAFYVDTVLPMGCGTSCAIFQRLTRAICWIMKRHFPDVEVFGYLDERDRKSVV